MDTTPAIKAPPDTPKVLNLVPKVQPKAAEFYASQFGWRVFPLYEVHAGVCSCKAGAECRTPGKHPRIGIPPSAKGEHPATTDIKKIREWWRKWPTANIGVWLAGSNTVVLDIDKNDKKDGFAGLADIMAYENIKDMPDTLTCETPSGGVHHYFQFCEGVPNKANALGPGLDTWHSGHYVIVPPSTHVKGVYRWKDGGAEQPVPFPEWLKPKARTTSGSGAGAGKKGRGRPPKEHFDAGDPEEVARLKHALGFVDNTDRDRWVMVGFALARAFDWGDEGFAVYDAWSKAAHNYDAKKTAVQYFKQSKIKPENPITVGSIFKWAQEGGWQGDRTGTKLRDADHYTIANEGIVAGLTAETGRAPVSETDKMWTVGTDALWRSRSQESLTVEIGKRFGGGKSCKRAGEFAAVARLAMFIAQDPDFFARASVGIAAPGGFYDVTATGKIECKPLTPEHRQRMRVHADPVIGGRPKLLLRMLQDAFDPVEADSQIQLLQQLAGCALTRTLWRHRIVALLLGVTSAGKSTFLSVLRQAFPRDQVAATTPERWSNEYYIATLAGCALNIVGELDPKNPIPGGGFKSVVGCDVIQGRHPTHRPFSFVCQAAHFFNSNRTPPTADHSDAFFRRWRVVNFVNSVSPDREQHDLDERIIAEEFGEFLGWALEGAAEVARTGIIMETEPHRRAIAKWRVENNSALAFLFDSNVVTRDAATETTGQVLFRRYRDWSAEIGVRCFGRTGFYEALTAGGAVAGVRVGTVNNQVVIYGVRAV